MAVVDKIEEEDGVITVYFNTPYEVFDPDLDPDLDNYLKQTVDHRMTVSHGSSGEFI